MYCFPNSINLNLPAIVTDELIKDMAATHLIITVGDVITERVWQTVGQPYLCIIDGKSNGQKSSAICRINELGYKIPSIPR